MVSIASEIEDLCLQIHTPPHSILLWKQEGDPHDYFRVSLVNESDQQETEECEKSEAWVFVPLALPYWVASL